MKQRVLNIFTEIIRCLYITLYRKPKNTIGLFFNKPLWCNQSYYPEKVQKKPTRILLDQLCQVWKYGTANDYYFLYGLDVKYGDEYRSYLHYTPFMRRRDKLNQQSQHSSTCILRNKFYFGIFADSIGVSTPKNIAYVQKGIVFVIQEKKYITLSEFVRQYNCSLFCKVMDGECGNGIFKLDILNGEILYNESRITLADLEDKIKGSTYLFQQAIQQHPEMSRMYDLAINSIRLVTVRGLHDGEIHVMPSILRIGTNGSRIDNTSQGGIAVGFDLQSGQLNKYGFYKPQYGLRTVEHPNSHVKFEQFSIPNLSQAIEQAKLFHSMLHDIHSIGWDIAIGVDGPIFIEGNDNWEINGPQSCNRGLAKEFYNLFY